MTEWATWNKRRCPLSTAFLLALVLGGRVEPELPNPNEPGSIDNLSDDDARLLVEEGRRQLDSQQQRFTNVQARAQALLTIALAVLAFAANAIENVATSTGGFAVGVERLLTAIAMLLVLAGVGLAAAINVVRADFDQTDTTQISRWSAPLLPNVAADYTKVVRRGHCRCTSHCVPTSDTPHRVGRSPHSGRTRAVLT